MNSKRVAYVHALLQNIANTLCFLVLFDARGVRLSNLDGGRNTSKPDFRSAKCMKIRIRQLATLGHRKIELLDPTRMQFLRSAIEACASKRLMTFFPFDIYSAKS